VIGKSLVALYSPDNPEKIEENKKNILKIDLVEILFYTLQLELNAFIEFLKNSPDSKQMIEGIINNLFYGDQGLQIQTGELIKFLIDVVHEKKNEILDIFYDNFLPAFVEHYKKLENNEKFYSFVQQFIEILIHCLKTHGYRIRHYFISHKLLHKLYPGFHSKEKSIHLALVRLVKNMALSQDEFLIKYIANNNLLDEIFEIYAKNAYKNNLINSVCLEFFTLLWKENVKKLVIEFVERFRERIIQMGLERFFEKMINKYEQISQDPNTETSTIEFQNGTKFSGSAMTDTFGKFTPMERESLEDEEYFENEDDEDKMKQEQLKDDKMVDENSIGMEKPLNTSDSNANMLSEEQIKSSQDSLQRMKNKIASKKLEAEEENKFVFGNKAKIKPNTNKSLGGIKIQFDLSSIQGGQSNGNESSNGKRPGGDLTRDEELTDAGVDPQKKIKL